MVNGDIRGQERRVSCKRRGAMPNLGGLSAQPDSRLLPEMAPKPCPSPGY